MAGNGSSELTSPVWVNRKRLTVKSHSLPLPNASHRRDKRGDCESKMNGMRDTWTSAVVAQYEDNDIPRVASLTPSDETDKSTSNVDEAREQETSEKKLLELAKNEEAACFESPKAHNNSRDNIVYLSPTLSETSPKSSSPFRQSLDDEAKEKDRQRQLEQDRINNSKKLLRESIEAMMAKDGTQSG